MRVSINIRKIRSFFLTQHALGKWFKQYEDELIYFPEECLYKWISNNGVAETSLTFCLWCRIYPFVAFVRTRVILVAWFELLDAKRAVLLSELSTTKQISKQTMGYCVMN